MRVLQLITSLDVGGAEMACLRVSRELKKRGHEVAIATLKSGGALAAAFHQADIPIYSIYAISEIRAFRPDIMQSWMVHANVLSRCYLPVTGARRLIWNVRQTLNRYDEIPWLTRVFLRLSAPLSQGADAIIYNSFRGRTDHEAIGYESRKGLVIGNGFERPELPAGAREAKRRRLGLEETSLAIAFVGRDHPDKGPDEFLRAACDFARDNLHAVFLIIGKGFEDSSSRALSIPAEMRSRFRFLGSRSEAEVMEILNAADVFTSSSNSEGFSNVIAEAMLMGCAPVVTDVGDSKRIVGESGKVVAPRNVDALVGAWKELAASGSDRIHQLGNTAQARCAAEFSLSACIDRYEQLYEMLLKGVHEP